MAQAGDRPITNSGITVTDLIETEGEPRVPDLRLAAALGFVNTHAIRTLIGRHLQALRRFGEVSLRREKPGKKGGRPGSTYHLNRKQALYITAKSDTERSADIAIQMVEIFDEYMKGTLPPKPVRVKAHQRALPKPPEAALVPRLDRDGLALMRIEGETVLVDTARFKLGPNELAVRIHRDGHISLGPVFYDGLLPSPHSAREAADEWKPPAPDGSYPPGVIFTRGYVQVLGVVITPRPDIAPGKGRRTASVKARRPASPGRRVRQDQRQELLLIPSLGTA